jgi:hypothetical protein
MKQPVTPRDIKRFIDTLSWEKPTDAGLRAVENVALDIFEVSDSKKQEISQQIRDSDTLSGKMITLLETHITGFSIQACLNVMMPLYPALWPELAALLEKNQSRILPFLKDLAGLKAYDALGFRIEELHRWGIKWPVLGALQRHVDFATNPKLSENDDSLLDHRIDRIIDRMLAGIKTGNVWAVQQASDMINQMTPRKSTKRKASGELRRAAPELTAMISKKLASNPADVKIGLHMMDSLEPSAWPELVQALEDNKASILGMLLEKVHLEHYVSAIITIGDLRAWGITWPELDRISKGVTAMDKSTLLKENKSFADDPRNVRMLRNFITDLANGIYESVDEIIMEVAWLDDVPDISNELDRYKHQLMNHILTVFKSYYGHTWNMQYYVTNTVAGLHRLGVRWPQLDRLQAISDNLPRDRQDVDEESVPDYTDDAEELAYFIDRLQAHFRLALWAGIHHMETVGVTVGQHPDIAAVVEQYKDQLLSNLIQDLKSVNHISRAGQNAKRLIALGIKWNELSKIRDAAKNALRITRK